MRQRTASTSPPAAYPYHCFISYTTREHEVAELKPLVDRMAARLKESGVVVCPVYYDGWYLTRRSYKKPELAGFLYSALAASAFTICFISPGYIESPWCRFEWSQTKLIHERREAPAPEHSILPVLWKPLAATYFAKARRAFKAEVRDRLRLWRGYPGVVPQGARAVDLTGTVDLHGGSFYTLLLAVQEYLDRWYPEGDWRAISGEEL